MILDKKNIHDLWEDVKGLNDLKNTRWRHDVAFQDASLLSFALSWKFVMICSLIFCCCCYAQMFRLNCCILIASSPTSCSSTVLLEEQEFWAERSGVATWALHFLWLRKTSPVCGEPQKSHWWVYRSRVVLTWYVLKDVIKKGSKLSKMAFCLLPHVFFCSFFFFIFFVLGRQRPSEERQDTYLEFFWNRPSRWILFGEVHRPYQRIIFLLHEALLKSEPGRAQQARFNNFSTSNNHKYQIFVL